MATIRNPILRGFNPDPCICRAGDDYYIATSTFEWWPGVQIHHSRDLVNWRLVGRALDRVSQLDIKGIEYCEGVWAPALSYADGRFWLVFANVLNAGGQWKDSPCYLVTAKDPAGPWSEPIYLNAYGFDPSLFHDEDGRKWLLNMLWDGRKIEVKGQRRTRFAGIVMQEYDAKAGKLVGPVHNIWKGGPIGTTEGPHMYKINGWYYLVTAEGGTGEGHMVSVARSKSLTGPFEIHPQNPLVTARDKKDSPFIRVGHGSFVQTPGGGWYVAHLCSQPVTDPTTGNRYAILGRETAIQKFVWCEDGWPRLEDGTSDAKVEVPAPDMPPYPWPADVMRDDFDGPGLNIHWQTLREPLDEKYCSLKDRKGWLRLSGGASLHCRYRQSLIARRIQSVHSEVETCMEFDPENIQQLAGLIVYYDRLDYYYLCVMMDDDGKPTLTIYQEDRGVTREYAEARVPAPQKLWLKAKMDGPELRFFWSGDGKDWQQNGPAVESWKISDQASSGSFTGGFYGICCQDMSGQMGPAWFDYFDYRQLQD